MRISTTIIAAALAFVAAAVPAKRTPFTVTQPDGTTVTLPVQLVVRESTGPCAE